MELEHTPFYREVKKIITQKAKPVHFHWMMTIVAGGKKIKPIKFLSLAIRRNYQTDYGDDIICEVMLQAGTYHHSIFPNKDNLRVTLTREPLYEVNVDTNAEEPIEALELRAVLTDYSSAVVESNRQHIENPVDTNTLDVMTVRFGLIDDALEKIRMMTFGGIYRNVTTWELLRHILTVASREVTDDLDLRIRGVDVYTPSSHEKKTNILIPTGTRLTDVAGYLHERVSGVYNAGFGYFLQKPPPRVIGQGDQIYVEKKPVGKLWFVYPTMDIHRFNNSPKGLTLIRIPMERFSGTERTYRRTANQVIALVSESARSVDDSEEQQYNHGNGATFADANLMFDAFSKTNDNKTIITRKENINEYLLESRATSLVNVHQQPSRITSNAVAEAGHLGRRLGMFVTCSWDHSEPGAIFPGMPVKYMYMAKGQPYEAYGIVQAVQHYSRLAVQGLTSKRHITSTSFLLFLGKAMPWKD